MRSWTLGVLTVFAAAPNGVFGQTAVEHEGSNPTGLRVLFAAAIVLVAVTLGVGIPSWIMLRYAKGPTERAFVLRCGVIWFLGTLVLGYGCWLLPRSYANWLSVIYVFCMFSGSSWYSKRIIQIRNHENPSAAPGEEGGTQVRQDS